MDDINNNQDNIDDTTIYDNLNIYEEQNSINIELIYYTSYLTHKKKMFISNMKDDFNLIISLFDVNICDILINIYILKKKNKINDKEFMVFKSIFDYVKKINDINYIDQEIFLLLLIDLYKLNNLCIVIDLFFKDYIFKELINYKRLINKIRTIYNKLNEKIFIFKIFDELNETVEPNIIKNKIIYLAKKISFDLFIFYNSHNVFEIFLNCIIDIDNFYVNLNFEKNLHHTFNKNKNLLNSLKMNKGHFIKEYDKSVKKYQSVYFNDIELYVKFKINKSKIIDDFIKNILYIEEIQ